MKLGLVANPSQKDIKDFHSLESMFDSLRPDQEVRVQQIMDSWGFRKYGLPVSYVRKAINKVLQNFP